MPKVINSKIISIELISSSIRKYTIELDKPVNYEAGQYLQFALENTSASDYWPESRAFSIASKNSDKLIELYIKRSGEFTSLIHHALSVGDEISLKLPYGDFVLPNIDLQSKIVCISNGVGITPFLSYIDYLNKNEDLDRFYLFHSIRNMEDLIGKDKIDNIAKEHFKLFLTGELVQGTVNRRMTIFDILSFGFNKDTLFYLSGTNDFILNIEMQLIEHGYMNIKKEQW